MRKLIYLIIGITTLSCFSQEKNLPEEFDFGRVENGLYTNDFFNMGINFNPNWAIQNRQQLNNIIENGKNLVAGDDENLKAVIKAGQVNTAYLLTVFKNEVGSAVEFNPSFLVVAENTQNFPGIKSGKDYLFHAKKLLIQSQIAYYFEKDVFEKKIGDSIFYVMEAKFDYIGSTITQEYFTTVTRGFSLSYIVSYTTEGEKNELYEIIDKIKI